MRHHFPAFVKISLMLLVEWIKPHESTSSETTAEAPRSGFQLSKLTKQASHFTLVPGFCFKPHRISEAKILPIPRFRRQRIQPLTAEADGERRQTNTRAN